MSRRSWDVQDLIGQHAGVRLIDDSSEAWGHINFDDLKGDIICDTSLNGWMSYCTKRAMFRRIERKPFSESLPEHYICTQTAFLGKRKKINENIKFKIKRSIQQNW